MICRPFKAIFVWQWKKWFSVLIFFFFLHQNFFSSYAVRDFDEAFSHIQNVFWIVMMKIDSMNNAEKETEGKREKTDRNEKIYENVCH